MAEQKCNVLWRIVALFDGEFDGKISASAGSSPALLVNVQLYQVMLDRESMSNTKAPAGVAAPAEAEDEIAEQLSHFDNITVRVQRQGERHG